MQTHKFVERHEVQSRLSELGLDDEVLWDVVRRSELAFRNSTANHPPLYPGFVAWAEAVRGLREALAPRGWRRCDDFSYSLCINPTGDIAIAVATGNEGTGLVDSDPSTKSTKGPSTHDAVAWNQLKLGLFPDGDPNTVAISRPADGESDRVTWMLLIHRSGSEVRCELSLPATMAEGRPDGWKERIILGTFKGDPELMDVAPPELPNVTVEIKRKA